MARGFSTTSGVATTDRILTTLSAKSTLRSFSILAYANSYPSSPRVFDDGGTPVERFIGSTTIFEFLRAWSGSNATWTITSPSTGAWHHLGLTYDGSSTANDPLIYVDGVSQTVTRTVAPVGTLVTTAQALNIGNRAAQDRVWDGMFAEWGVWNRILTQEDITDLANAASPLLLRSGLLDYMPMIRNNVSRLLSAPTLTGTAVKDHPRVIYPASSWQTKFAPVTPPTPVTGTVAIMLPPVAEAATAAEQFVGTAAITLPSLQANADGGSGPGVITGTVAIVLPPLDDLSFGEEGISGTMAIVLPAAVPATTAAELISGTVALVLPPVAEASSGAEAVSGTVELVLPPARLAAREPLTNPNQGGQHGRRWANPLLRRILR